MPEIEEVERAEPILDEPVVDAPEVERPETDPDSEPEVEQERRAGGGVNKRIAKLTADKYAEREARIRAEVERDEARRQLESRTQPQPKSQSLDREPTLDDFKDDPDPYLSWQKATIKWETRQAREEDRAKAAEQAQQAKAKELTDSYQKRLAEARERYEDWDETFSNEVDIPISLDVEEAIKGLENGPDVAYYLKHRDEAKSLLSMTPHSAVVRIGIISASLNPNNSPETRSVSRAAAPIKPVGASSTRSTRSLEEMSQKEYNRVRDEQERKRREG